MKKYEELFSLVKSLSKSEKRYFKLFCTHAGHLNYFKLFDAIDSQKAYDERAIKRKFKGEPFIRQLHVTKNYLRSLILKSLRNYNGKLSKDAEVKDILRNVEILFKKELYQLCQTEITKAERIARAFELEAGLFEIIEWKRMVVQAVMPTEINEFDNLLSEQQTVLDSMQTTLHHRQIMADVARSMMEGKNVKVRHKGLLKKKRGTPFIGGCCTSLS